MKRIVVLLLVLPLLLSLCGCWDYRGGDELAIVTGIAIDLPEEADTGYRVSFELLEISDSASEDKFKTKLITVEGKTVNDAILEAANQLKSQIYFGDAAILAFSEELLCTVPIDQLLEPMMRNVEMRGIIWLVVARGCSASELIAPQDGEDYVVSFELAARLNDDTQTESITQAQHIYQSFNTLKTKTTALTQAALKRSSDDDDNSVISTDGIAYFDGSLLAGFVEQEDMLAYLLLTQELKSMAFTFTGIGQLAQAGDITLLLSGDAARLEVEQKDDNFVLHVALRLEASAVELSSRIDILDEEKREMLTQQAAAALEEQIIGTIAAAQAEGIDMLGFSDVVYRSNPKLWSALKLQWSELFAQALVTVSCVITIDNSGVVEKW